MKEEIQFCKGGGCTAKLGAGILEHILSALPKPQIRDERLLIGYESADDAAVYRVTDDIAIVQTLDFFPPMVEDPYVFGQIAAANALSDIYAMGGDVHTALNIVCFPEKMDLNILGNIMQGGSEKVIEAGGTLVGGHSIADSDVKYGLSVMGTVHPAHIFPAIPPKPFHQSYRLSIYRLSIYRPSINLTDKRKDSQTRRSQAPQSADEVRWNFRWSR